MLIIKINKICSNQAVLTAKETQASEKSSNIQAEMEEIEKFQKKGVRNQNLVL